MSYLSLSCALLLAGVFGAAAAGKVAGKARGRTAFADFRVAVERLGGVPRRWSAPVGYAIVAAELAAGGLLLAPQTRRAGAGTALALLVAFTSALVRAVRRGARQPCQCFGLWSAPVSGRQVARNAVLAGCAVAVLATPVGGVGLAPALVCLLGAVAGAAAVVTWDEIAALSRG